MSDRERLYYDLLSRHNTMLCSLYRAHSVGNEYLYQEFRQVVEIQLWREIEAYGMSRFRYESSEDTWIYHIAQYAIISYKRSFLHPDITLEASIEETALPPFDDLMISEVDELLNLLSPIERRIMTLTMNGYSHEEIAEMECMTRKAAGLRLWRIRKKLEKILKKTNSNRNKLK